MPRIGDRPPVPPQPPPDAHAAGEAGPASSTGAPASIAGIAGAIASAVQGGEKDPAKICAAVVDNWITANVPEKSMSKGAREALRTRLTEALRDDPLLRQLI